MHILKEKRVSTWEPKARKAVFVGYGEDKDHKRAWILYDPYHRKKIISCHVVFWENEFWSKGKQNDGETLLDEINRESGDREVFLNDVNSDIEDTPDVIEQPEPPMLALERPLPNEVPPPINQNGIRNPEEDVPEEQQAPAVPPAIPQPELREARPVREKRRPARYGDYVQLVQHEDRLDTQIENAFLSNAEQDHRQTRFDEAKLEELRSMAENEVWELVPPQKGRKAIGCRWVCTDKQLVEGTKPKARPVAQGFSQIPGVDYNEIFSPVIRLESVRFIVALAAMYDLEMIQADVKTAFLYGVLEEDQVFMKQPPGHEDDTHPDWWCCLRKAIYGLHQSPRAFYRHIKGVLKGIGLKALFSDYSVFASKDHNGVITILGLYVDDAILVCSCKKRLAEVRSYLSTQFKMTWTEEPKMLLGIEIDRNRTEGTIKISQRRLVEDILQQFQMSTCAPARTPMTNIYEAYGKDKRPAPQTQYPFLSFIRKANYLARGT